jgi:hypothetical protein
VGIQTMAESLETHLAAPRRRRGRRRRRRVEGDDRIQSSRAQQQQQHMHTCREEAQRAGVLLVCIGHAHGPRYTYSTARMTTTHAHAEPPNWGGHASAGPGVTGRMSSTATVLITRPRYGHHLGI